MKLRHCIAICLLALVFVAASAKAAENPAAEEPGAGQADQAAANKTDANTEKDLKVPVSPDYSENRFSMAIYGGYLTSQVFSELYSGPNELVNTKMVALSVSRELFSVGHALGVNALAPLKLEVEGIAALHMGQWPESQTFSEFAGSFNLRWHRFPWNRHVVTTMGIGEGFSYASEKPKFEEELITNTAHFLNYVMFDVTVAHPDLPELALLLRLHHRSGIFGLIDGVHGGSNFFVGGLKYTF